MFRVFPNRIFEEHEVEGCIQFINPLEVEHFPREHKSDMYILAGKLEKTCLQLKISIEDLY